MAGSAAKQCCSDQLLHVAFTGIHKVQRSTVSGITRVSPPRDLFLHAFAARSLHAAVCLFIGGVRLLRPWPCLPALILAVFRSLVMP
eukprot:364682-Chlamydomonas_euryale.AAC.16